jgi:transposase
MTVNFLGIDISKKDFHVVLITGESRTKPRKFTNDPKGFESLHEWLKQKGIDQLHACLEATSIYGDALAEFLYSASFAVSVVNPARIKGFGKGELLRTKTDSVDSALIARFCAAIKPDLWKPTAPEIKELQALVRRLDSLQEIVTAEQNRLETATAKVAELTNSHLEYLKQQQDLIKQLISDHFDQHPDLKQQRDLLVSIPGIGTQTAAVLLDEIGRIEDYQSARLLGATHAEGTSARLHPQLAAHAGLTPSERSSGMSVHGKTRLSCTGNSRLRKALYIPAVVSMRHNPLLKAFRERLLDRGKAKMQAIGAIMRKLVHLAFGILKSQQPFDPNYAIDTP